MGQSTDAILFYGYCWDEEGERLFSEHDGEWPEIIALREGAVNPWDLYTSSGAEAEHSRLPLAEQNAAFEKWKYYTGFQAKLDEWYAVTKEAESRFSDIKVSSHCSCDYPMPYIAIKSTETTAWRGSPQSINPSSVVSDTADYTDTLARFVEELDVDISGAQGPAWFLVSNWC
jgi:hypothetical protein